jgi:hypothetical protein
VKERMAILFTHVNEDGMNMRTLPLVRMMINNEGGVGVVFGNTKAV